MKFRKSLSILLLVLSIGSLPAQGREPGKINHPPGPPPSAALFKPGGVHSGYVPKFSPDFWKRQLNNRLKAGTTLTGVLQQTLSSRKSKPGDVFEILLEDGVASGQKLVVPPGSRILGSVVSVSPASSFRQGNPGRLQVALKSLVLPDEQSVPIYGFIDENLNLLPKEAKHRYAGQSIADYGQSVKSFLGSFGTGIGAILVRRHRGKDFELAKDQIVTVRINRSLDVPEPIAKPAVAAGSPPVPQVPNQVPGLVNVPGQPGIQPAVQPEQLQPPVQATTPDPNAVFSQPINPMPLSDIPDPF